LAEEDTCSGLCDPLRSYVVANLTPRHQTRREKLQHPNQADHRRGTYPFLRIDRFRLIACTIKTEGIVPVGSLSPNSIQLPGIYVGRIVKATAPKQIEPRTLASPPTTDTATEKGVPLDQRRRIARRAAKEIKDGFYVNLGIPGTGSHPTGKRLDADIINAGKETVTLLPGASVFDSRDSFVRYDSRCGGRVVEGASWFPSHM